MKKVETEVKDDHEEWKEDIQAISDPKLLDYIQSICSARSTTLRADKEVKGKSKKPEYETDDPDEIG